MFAIYLFVFCPALFLLSTVLTQQPMGCRQVCYQQLTKSQANSFKYLNRRTRSSFRALQGLGEKKQGTDRTWILQSTRASLCFHQIKWYRFGQTVSLFLEGKIHSRHVERQTVQRSILLLYQ